MRFPRHLFALILVAPLGFAACGDEDADDNGAADSGTTDTGTGADTSMADAGMEDVAMEDTAVEDTGPTAMTLTELHAAVIAPSCGGFGCHLNGGIGGSLNLDLNDGLRDRLLANAPGVNFPYVTPGDVESSYLWYKLNNTQVTVGGGGSRMPSIGSITAEQLAAVEAWIAAGAPE